VFEVDGGTTASNTAKHAMGLWVDQQLVRELVLSGQ
jgi:hypothetical protein